MRPHSRRDRRCTGVARSGWRWGQLRSETKGAMKRAGCAPDRPLRPRIAELPHSEPDPPAILAKVPERLRMHPLTTVFMESGAVAEQAAFPSLRRLSRSEVVPNVSGTGGGSAGGGEQEPRDHGWISPDPRG